jgi:hypothetical protein
MKAPEAGAARENFAAMFGDHGAGGLLILRQRFLAIGTWSALDQNDYAHRFSP